MTLREHGPPAATVRAAGTFALMASGATLLLGLLSGSPAAVAVAVVLAVVGVGLRIEAAVRESRHS